jgi:hypothetical protein
MWRGRPRPRLLIEQSMQTIPQHQAWQETSLLARLRGRGRPRHTLRGISEPPILF